MTAIPTFLPFVTNYSEDYYGDLDLKSIRKSELLAGLQNNDQSRAQAAKAATKPRPSVPAANSKEAQ